MPERETNVASDGCPASGGERRTLPEGLGWLPDVARPRGLPGDLPPRVGEGLGRLPEASEGSTSNAYVVISLGVPGLGRPLGPRGSPARCEV